MDTMCVQKTTEVNSSIGSCGIELQMVVRHHVCCEINSSFLKNRYTLLSAESFLQLSVETFFESLFLL